MRRKKMTLTLATMVAMGFATSYAGAAMIAASNSDTFIEDTGSAGPPKAYGDGQGDNVRGDTLASLAVGEALNNKDETLRRTVIPFDLTSDLSSIDTSEPITLTFNTNTASNVDGATFSLRGLPNRTDTSVVESDYEASATSIDSDLPKTTGSHTIDVSSFVSSEINGGASFVAFRIQGTGYTLNDSTQRETLLIDSANTQSGPSLTYTPVPEPGSLALATVGLLFLGYRPGGGQGRS